MIGNMELKGDRYPIELCLSAADLLGWGIDPLAEGLLALSHPDDEAQLVFPAFQFVADPESSAYALHPAASAVNVMLREAGHSPDVIVQWWYAVNSSLNGDQPRNALAYDQPHLVLMRAVQVHLSGK